MDAITTFRLHFSPQYNSIYDFKRGTHMKKLAIISQVSVIPAPSPFSIILLPWLLNVVMKSSALTTARHPHLPRPHPSGTGTYHKTGNKKNAPPIGKRSFLWIWWYYFYLQKHRHHHRLPAGNSTAAEGKSPSISYDSNSFYLRYLSDINGSSSPEPLILYAGVQDTRCCKKLPR